MDGSNALNRFPFAINEGVSVSQQISKKYGTEIVQRNVKQRVFKGMSNKILAFLSLRTTGLNAENNIAVGNFFTSMCAPTCTRARRR
jgi:hypothetical protein